MRALTLFVLVVSCASARGQVIPRLPTAVAADSLTVYQALALLEGDHPYVRSATAQATSREAAARGVTPWAAPTLGYAMEGIGVDGGFEQRVLAGIEVGPLALARAERQRLDAERRAFGFDAETIRRELRARVVAAYVELGVADSLVALASESVALADRLAEVARLREAGGEAAGLETLRAELEAEQARAALAAALGRRASQRAATAGALGMGAGAVPVAPPLALPDGLWRAAPEARSPALAAADARVEAAAFAVDAARAAKRPVWSAEVFPQHFGGSSVGAGFQVGVRLPLGQGRLTAARAEATQALRFSAEAERDALQIERDAAVRTARARVESALAALEAARSGPVQRADELLTLALRGYQLGEVTQQVVLDTRRAVLDTRRAGLDALANALLALAELERTTGTPLLFSTR